VLVFEDIIGRECKLEWLYMIFEFIFYMVGGDWFRFRSGISVKFVHINKIIIDNIL
jgi:hypothetical protein